MPKCKSTYLYLALRDKEFDIHALMSGSQPFMAGNNRIRTTLYHLVLVERIAHSLKLQFRLWRETY